MANRVNKVHKVFKADQEKWALKVLKVQLD